MVKPIPPEMKKELLANIIQNACRDFQVPDVHIERFTQEVTESAAVFEPFPPADRDELRALIDIYSIAKNDFDRNYPQDISNYAGITANYYLATIAGLDDPQKYAGGLPPEKLVRKLLGAGRDNLS